MSYKAVGFSHGAFRPHFEAPQHIPEHHRENETQQTRILASQQSVRYQQRHPSGFSGSTPDLKKKILAIFFLSLLVTNDPRSSWEGPRPIRYRPHAKTNPQPEPKPDTTHEEPETNAQPSDLAPQAIDPSQNDSATESPALPRPEHSEDDSLLKSAINTIGNSFGPLLLGPLGGLLSFSTPASAFPGEDKLSKFLFSTGPGLNLRL